MAFTGGPLDVTAIVPSYTKNLGSQTSATGVVQAQNQVWQGAGEAFIGKPGQPLTGALTGSPINVALNSEVAKDIAGKNTTLFSSGNNVLAPTLTRFVGGNKAFSLNGMIGSTLKSAGPFGSILSAGGSSLASSVTSLSRGGLSSIGRAASGLFGAANYIMFPGGGDEGASNYSGSPYSLQDVTFSLQPANRGPQSFGSSSATTFPKSMTTLPFNEYTSMPPLAGSPTSNALKSSAMVGGLSQKAFSPSLSSTSFNTSTPRLF